MAFRLSISTRTCTQHASHLGECQSRVRVGQGRVGALLLAPVSSHKRPCSPGAATEDTTGLVACCGSTYRRALLTAVPSAVALPFFLACGQVQAAERIPLSNEELRNSVFANSFVIPALKVPEYLRRIYAARPAAWRQINELVSAGKYKDLSDNLSLSPFDEVRQVRRQACFFIPRAMLSTDGSVEQAVDAQLSYNAFLNKVKAFDAMLISAERGEQDEAGVRAAADELSASLDDFLQIVTSST